MIRCLPAILLVAVLAAAEEPRQLDPTKPADAVQIIEILTRDISLPRHQAEALIIAIQTLSKAVEPQPQPVTVKEP